MTIYLYNITDEETAVPKNLSNTFGGVVGTIRGEIDVITPKIELQTNNNKFEWNYIFIPDFKRYYFVRNWRMIRTGIVELQLAVDVLQSHYNQFFDCPIIVNRSDSTYNSYIADNKRQYYQYQHNQYVTIGDIGLPSAMIVTTVG